MARSAYSLKQVVVVQAMVAAMAIAMGASVGWLLGREAFLDEFRNRFGKDPDAIAADLDTLNSEYEALYDRCEPLEGSERDRLIEAQERVESLRNEISEKQAEVARLEIEAHENSTLRQQLKERKQELARLQGALQVAEQRRTELVEKLKEAIVEVSVARAETRAAKRETLVVRWDEFKNRAMLEVCAKGGKGKLEKCRASVEAAMTPERERRYRECVRAGQAVPQLRRIAKNEERLPSYAEWLDQTSRFTRNEWYILFCDPTLPEASGSDELRSTVGESDPGEAGARKDAFLESMKSDDL